MGIKNSLSKKISKGKKNKGQEVKEESKQFSSSFLNLIDEYKKIVRQEQEVVISPIHVDELASRIASFYEKIRRIIDWKEEHLIRRVAIERILKRKMISQISGMSIISGLNAGSIAEPLVLELIRNGYFPNNKISKDKIGSVKKVLTKYVYILQNGSPTKSALSLKIKTKVRFYNWILSIAACEIEEILNISFFENTLINFMTYRIYERIKIYSTNTFSNDIKFYQTYIAVHRSLFNLDPPIITYHLIRCRYPQWVTQADQILDGFTKDIVNIWESFNKELVYPQSGYFYKICEKYDTVYLVIGDILKEYKDDISSIEEKFVKPSLLQEVIKKVYDKRLSTLKKRLRRSAVYSTLSIFLAGGVSLFIIEVPIARIFYGRFNILAVVIDLLIPTIFMFILVALIRLPSKNNFQRVVEEVKKIIYENPEMDVYEIDLNKKKNFFKNLIFSLVFLLFGVFALAGIFWIFYIAKVPWTSVYIDTINIAVVVFAALVIRQRAKEMTVEESSNLFEFLLDIIAIPIAKIGQWFAIKWQEYNFVSVFFSALVDTPFVKIIDIFEDWRNYLKDKKAGIH